jgi:hypothetical protein
VSIPAFVIDANKRPLLPSTPAYARVLLRDGKAQRIPHPALAIIQLSHAIDAPQMPSVLIGFVVHAQTASLGIFTETFDTTPLLSLTLDLSGITTASHRAVALTALARTLGTLLPISQGALLTQQPVPDDTAHAAAIHTTMTTLEACLRYPITLLSRNTPRMADNPLLGAFQQQMRQGYDTPTCLVAAYLPCHQPEAQQPSGALSEAVRLAETDPVGLLPGMIVQTRQQHGTVTGLVQAVEPDGLVQMRVPTSASITGVTWADMQVWPPLHGWQWAAQHVVVLPVTHKLQDRKG